MSGFEMTTHLLYKSGFTSSLIVCALTGEVSSALEWRGNNSYHKVPPQDFTLLLFPHNKYLDEMGFEPMSCLATALQYWYCFRPLSYSSQVSWLFFPASVVYFNCQWLCSHRRQITLSLRDSL